MISISCLSTSQGHKLQVLNTGCSLIFQSLLQCYLLSEAFLGYLKFANTNILKLLVSHCFFFFKYCSYYHLTIYTFYLTCNWKLYLLSYPLKVLFCKWLYFTKFLKVTFIKVAYNRYSSICWMNDGPGFFSFFLSFSGH